MVKAKMANAAGEAANQAGRLQESTAAPTHISDSPFQTRGPHGGYHVNKGCQRFFYKNVEKPWMRWSVRPFPAKTICVSQKKHTRRMSIQSSFLLTFSLGLRFC